MPNEHFPFFSVDDSIVSERFLNKYATNVYIFADVRNVRLLI